ncbi:MAG: 3-hydroxyacyl-CoA dehydrogenase family protein [Thermoguttaceae bacterium]|jgi:3-hydroxybutyryl-CoA dehydrogenase|nr:3-hydroxyacyl-CoA dehydrogenase family protein [Thermoguttaceae bacterium]
MIQTIETIGVAGLGLLGRGIAACLLGHGFRVVAFTRHEATHAAARESIARALGDLVDRAGFPASLLQEWAERYEPVQAAEPMAQCGFVVESVAEDLEAKARLFDQIEGVVGPEVPIASNTSALPVSRLQQGRRRPERFLGMHWAEPAHATRFMEIVRGEQTADEPIARAMALARRIGKEPSLVEHDVPAFVANRLGYAMYREALNLLDQGIADVETIDRSFRNAAGLWATICGPFRWIDLTGGPALYAKAMQDVLPTLSKAAELPRTLRDLAASDARGIANGRGFYQYTPEEVHRWEELLREHAWTVRDLMNRYFPLAGYRGGQDPGPERAQ